MPGPDGQVLRWGARAAGPSARVVSAAGMRAGGNPWLLRVAGARSTCEGVLKTGDAAPALDRPQPPATVPPPELAPAPPPPGPRLPPPPLDRHPPRPSTRR